MAVEQTFLTTSSEFKIETASILPSTLVISQQRINLKQNSITKRV